MADMMCTFGAQHRGSPGNNDDIVYSYLPREKSFEGIPAYIRQLLVANL